MGRKEGVGEIWCLVNQTTLDLIIGAKIQVRVFSICFFYERRSWKEAIINSKDIKSNYSRKNTSLCFFRFFSSMKEDLGKKLLLLDCC